MRAIAVVGLALLATPAFAQEGIYVGVGVGSFDYEEDTAFLVPRPFADTVSSWKLYGGFELNEYFAFEIRYGQTDEIEQRFSSMNPDLGDFSERFGVDFTTTSGVAMGVLPLEWGALIGGLGYFSTDAKIGYEITADCCGSFANSISIGDDGLMAVMGLEWRVGRFGTGVGVRLEYEWLDVEDANGSTLGIGVAYRF
jgi:opacity protein-like surface antigen